MLSFFLGSKLVEYGLNKKGNKNELLRAKECTNAYKQIQGILNGSKLI